MHPAASPSQDRWCAAKGMKLYITHIMWYYTQNCYYAAHKERMLIHCLLWSMTLDLKTLAQHNSASENNYHAVVYKLHSRTPVSHDISQITTQKAFMLTSYPSVFGVSFQRKTDVGFDIFAEQVALWLTAGLLLIRRGRRKVYKYLGRWGSFFLKL